MEIDVNDLSQAIKNLESKFSPRKTEMFRTERFTRTEKRDIRLLEELIEGSKTNKQLKMDFRVGQDKINLMRSQLSQGKLVTIGRRPKKFHPDYIDEKIAEIVSRYEILNISAARIVEICKEELGYQKKLSAEYVAKRLKKLGLSFKKIPMFRKKKNLHSNFKLLESGKRITEHLSGHGIPVFFDVCRFIIGDIGGRIWSEKNKICLPKADMNLNK